MSLGSSETMSVLMPTVRVPPFFGVCPQATRSSPVWRSGPAALATAASRRRSRRAKRVSDGSAVHPSKRSCISSSPIGWYEPRSESPDAEVRRSPPGSLDDLVRPSQHGLGNRESEYLGRLQIDYQLRAVALF